MRMITSAAYDIVIETADLSELHGGIMSVIAQSQSKFDVIIVGAGIGGSAAAYHCAKAGNTALLLEQFSLPHSRGSSHGGSRIIRYGYPQKHYQQMMDDAFSMWAELEKETNVTLYRQTGQLFVSTPPYDFYNTRLKQMRQSGRPFTELTTAERIKRFPGFRHSENCRSFFYEDAGFLKASKAVHCFQNEFVKRGGILHDEEQMLEIVPGTTLTVRTNRGMYQTRSVILTPGPWAAKVLKPLGLEPPFITWRINTTYWREKVPGTYSNFPVFTDDSKGYRHEYAIPPSEYPGVMKLAFHGGIETVDPDLRDTILHKRQWDIERLCKYVKEHFPGLEDRPCIIEPCMYTETSDLELILDRHPRHPNIILGCGFSGHGFKLAPVVGKILCDLATGKKPKHDIEPCSLKRFKNSGLLQSKL